MYGNGQNLCVGPTLGRNTTLWHAFRLLAVELA